MIDPHTYGKTRLLEVIAEIVNELTTEQDDKRMVTFTGKYIDRVRSDYRTILPGTMSSYRMAKLARSSHMTEVEAPVLTKYPKLQTHLRNFAVGTYRSFIRESRAKK